MYYFFPLVMFDSVVLCIFLYSIFMSSGRQTPAPHTLRRLALDIRKLLASKLGGSWAVTACSPDDFSFTRVTGRAPEAARDDDVRGEAVELCRQRYVTGASRQVMRDSMPRAVPWDIVERTWRGLCAGPPIVCRRSDDDDFVYARQSAPGKLALMMSALQAGGRLLRVDTPRAGEMWLRVGVDGVRMWKSNVISVTMAPCSDLVNLPMHSMHRFALLLVQRSQESLAALKFAIQDSGLAAELGGLNGSVQDFGMGPVRVRVFLCGDHMALYKLCGATGPSSTQPGLRPCPYCDAEPRLVNNIDFRPGAVLADARDSALVTLPPLQCPPDIMHGVSNVLYNSLLPCMQQWLTSEGDWSLVETLRFLNAYVTLPDLDVEHAPKVDRLARSIDSALRFFRTGRWRAMAPTVRLALRMRLPDGGSVGDKFAAAFGALAAQLEIAYMDAPSAVQIGDFDSHGAILRGAMSDVGAKCTPWVHVWLGHVPAFLRHWGTLFPFIGHGVEGRHRRMKREVSTSTCGQWKGDQVGFAHALRRDCVWWNLLADLGSPLVRSSSVQRRRAALFQRFRDEGGT